MNFLFKFKKIGLALFFLFLLIYPKQCYLQEKPIVVIIPSYNNMKWYKKNLTSVLNQKYNNYRIIYINDCSTDNTGAAVQAFLRRKDKKRKVTFINNKQRLGALHNLYNAINKCANSEIIVTVDGDDWLFNSNVLHIINKIYTNNNVWLTHGTFTEFPSKTTSWSEPIPKSIINSNNFRDYKSPTHLRTFYAGLFKKIRKEDLLYQGRFWEMTWDMAIMLPMIEMAGNRHMFIDKILYVYNIANPINDNKVNSDLQTHYDHIIRNMPKYSVIKEDKIF